jgi:acetyltransferase-like isoleucine patch superfamily enzyme
MSAKNPFDPGYYYTDSLKNFGFRKVGNNVAIAKDCVINGLGNISLGDNVRIDSKTMIIALSGKLEIGSYVHIGGGCYINSAGGISIGDFAGLSSGVSLFSASDDYSGKFLTNPTVPMEFRNINKKPIILNRHVIIGSGTVVLPGVRIEEGAAVGALSLVTKSIPGWKIYSGIPAKFFKDRSMALLEQEKLFLCAPVE